MIEIDFILAVVALCYVWFETDAFLEYAALLKLKFTKYLEFKDFQEKTPSFDYHNFLLLNHNNFFVRLITCPVCLIVWLNLIGLLVNDWETLGSHVVLSWFAYFGFVWAMRKFSDE